jgi:hypothetical protein
MNILLVQVHLFGFFPTLAWENILAHCLSIDRITVGEPENLPRRQNILPQ